MYGNAKQHLTIIGDRQSGRTHILALAAISDARQGRTVMWEGRNMAEVSGTMDEVAAIATEMTRSVSKVSRVNGRYAIEFHGGGVIRFRGPGPDRGSSDRMETHIMDDVAGEPHPDATRVYKALLR